MCPGTMNTDNIHYHDVNDNDATFQLHRLHLANRPYQVIVPEINMTTTFYIYVISFRDIYRGMYVHLSAIYKSLPSAM